MLFDRKKSNPSRHRVIAQDRDKTGISDKGYKLLNTITKTNFSKYRYGWILNVILINPLSKLLKKKMLKYGVFSTFLIIFRI